MNQHNHFIRNIFLQLVSENSKHYLNVTHRHEKLRYVPTTILISCEIKYGALPCSDACFKPRPGDQHV